MFTKKMTACLVGLACVAMATTSCTKQSTYTAGSLPNKASVEGIVVFQEEIKDNTGALVRYNYTKMNDVTVSLAVTVGGKHANTITTKTADGKYVFNNIPVSANWNATTNPVTTTVSITANKQDDNASPVVYYRVGNTSAPSVHPAILEPNIKSVVDTIFMVKTNLPSLP